MGLDAVELVMRVEEEFGIEIPDAEAEEAITVGKLYELVLSKLKPDNRDVCLTSTAFYRTRQAFVNVLQIPKQQIRPSTRLDAVIEEANRAKLWTSIQRTNSLRMPDLETNWILYGNCYPSGVTTVGELAEAVMVLNRKQLIAEHKGWSAPDVWKTLCAVIVDELGVRTQQITREAEFVEDLGVC